MTAAWLTIAMLSAAAAAGEEQVVSPQLDPDAHALVFLCDDERFDVTLRCPHVRLAGDAGAFGGDEPGQIRPLAQPDSGWECSYAPVELAGGTTLERVLCAQWSAEERVLRKWLRLRMTAGDAPVNVDEITLDTFAASRLTREFRPGPPQSYPLFVRGLFAGIEFPVASTRVEDGRAILGHRPRCTLEAGKWYESRRAVFGPARNGREVLAFHEYIERHRPAPKGMHFNYNSWWTAPVPFSEADILGLMREFEEHLYKQHGVAFDSFTIDMGWSDPHGVWDIDRRMFPDEFTKIQAGAEAMGSRLGLWTSPSSCYPPAVDPQWATEHGYERAINQMLSLAGEKYRNKYGATIADYVGRFKLGQVKLDGLYLGGPDYMAGPFPAEATAAGAAEAFDRMRAAGAEVWLEATYSAYASPWWLVHVNSVIGCFGDDSPHGRVPSPVYRESYTTARDYYNLQGADRLPSPIPAQEILGIIHQSDESFMNDAVTTVLRGHAFISLYVNPKYMNDRRWAMLARLIEWSRANAPLLTAPGTQPLRPATWLREGTPWLTHAAPMPREPYGYAHWSADRGLVLLRNPWVERQSYRLTLDPELQCPVSAVSLYPEPRLYAEALGAGDAVEIPLAPYETLVLLFAAGRPPAELPPADDAVGSLLAHAVKPAQPTMRRVVYEQLDQPFGVDYTSLAPPSGKAVEVQADFLLNRPARDARLRVLALLEGKSVPDARGALTADGREIPVRPIRSDAGFVATGAQAPECWQFLEGTLSPALFGAPEEGRPPQVEISMRLNVPDLEAVASIWVVADNPGEDTLPPLSSAAASRDLPSPEWIWRDSACILAPTPLTSLSEETHRKAEIEKIDGVFLDALGPAQYRQGWGTLQKNRSVWETELVIGDMHFRRGLGTHADSEIVYDLDGAYRRFQAWAGPDSATRGTVGFRVVVDGQTRWESGIMTRGDAPQQVDIDITGARQLRLLVDDAGDGIIGDHANWAEARLLR